MAAVTLQDVARRAGVSLATASRVVNGSERTPGREISERVRAAAADLGYVANVPAQALARASTQLIGLIVRDISDPYFSLITHGVQVAAHECGRQVLVANTGMDPADEHDAVLAFLAHRAEAIIVVGSRWDDGRDRAVRDELARHAQQGGRIAVVGQPLAFGRAIAPENRAGAAALAQALVAQGHRDFAVLCGPEALLTARERTEGFVTALGEHGIKPVETVPGGFSRDGGYEAAEQLAATAFPRDASLCVFAVNDVMAIGAIAAFRDRGLRVPDDVQVAGFDDIPTLRDFVPGLTTVRLPLDEIGRSAVRLVLEDSDVAASEISVAGEVVLRESTALLVDGGLGQQ